MDRVTKKSIEAGLANAVGRFQREQQGRGATDVRAHLLSDMVIIRSAGIFTPTEAHLAATEEGRRLIRSARQELRSINRPELETIIAEIVETTVLRSYYDLDVEIAEQVEVFILTEDVEQRLLREEMERLARLAPPVDRAVRRL